MVSFQKVFISTIVVAGRGKGICKQKTTAWTNRFEHGRGASQASALLLFCTRKITTTKIW